MKKNIITSLIIGMLMITSCANTVEVNISENIIEESSESDSVAEDSTTDVGAQSEASSESTKSFYDESNGRVTTFQTADLEETYPGAKTKDSDSIQVMEMVEYYEEENAFSDYDHDLVDKYLALSQEKYDSAPMLEDYKRDTTKDDLYLVKLADYAKDRITIYGIGEGVIISYKGEKQFFPCNWMDMYPTHRVGLCDIDADGNKELIFVTNSVRGNGFVINREVLRVFKFEETDGIEMFRLSEEKVVSMLNKIIQYDAEKKSVLVTQGDNIVQEISMSAFERLYWGDDPSKPLENEIEYIDYVNDWWYEITDSDVILNLEVRLGGETLSFGLFAQDENEEIIKTSFDVRLKDGEFTLEYDKTDR